MMMTCARLVGVTKVQYYYIYTCKCISTLFMLFIMVNDFNGKKVWQIPYYEICKKT